MIIISIIIIILLKIKIPDTLFTNYNSWAKLKVNVCSSKIIFLKNYRISYLKPKILDIPE